MENPAVWIAGGTLFVTLMLQAVSYGMLRRQAADAEKKADKAQSSANESKAALAAFREEAARRFVTDDMLESVEKRIVASIDRLGDRMDRVFDRFLPPSPKG